MKLTFFFLLVSTLALSQIKKYVLPCTSLFVSGAIDGTGEVIDHHYAAFQKVFPDANPGFWNPSISWLNKYKNSNPTMGRRFFGSEGSLVFLTDGYHALRAGRNVINTGTLIYYLGKSNTKKLNLRRILTDIAILTIARDAGLYLTYNLVFKPH